MSAQEGLGSSGRKHQQQKDGPLAGTDLQRGRALDKHQIHTETCGSLHWCPDHITALLFASRTVWHLPTQAFLVSLLEMLPRVTRGRGAAGQQN